MNHPYGAAFKAQHFDRFYLGDIGYFPFGEVINTPEIYSGITTGTIVGCREGQSDTTYVVRIDLPEGHIEASDENGSPQQVKFALIKQSEATTRNPVRWFHACNLLNP